MQRWNINYLKELHDKYLRLSATTSDPTLSLEYENTVNSILCIIERYDELVNKRYRLSSGWEINNYRNIIEDDFAMLDYYGIYCPYVRQIGEVGEQLVIQPNDDLTTITTSTDKILKIGQVFFDSVGGYFASKYSTLTSRFKDTLHIRTLPKDIVTVGQTYSVYNTDITFIELGINKTLQDYVSAIHEFGHGISCAINPTAMYDFGKYCFIELESLFFELLSLDFLSDELGLVKDSFDISTQLLKDYSYSSQLISAKLDMYNDLNDSQLYKKKTVEKYLINEVGCSDLGVKEVLKIKMRDNLHYIISYLTAIELYLIYISDKRLALDLLLKITLSSQPFSIDYLNYVKSLGLEPGRNLDKYIQILFGKAKDLSDEKSLRYKNC